MSRWFRLDDDVINEPKVLMLPEATRWHWIAMLCAASKNDGMIPPIDHLALMLRVTKQAAAAIVATLHSAGLLDKTDAGFEPHNWSARQYASDSSAERMKRHRDRKKRHSDGDSDGDGDVTVTPQRTTDTQSDKQHSTTEAVSVSLRVLKTDLLEAFGGRDVNLDLSASWLAKGYSRDLILDVVKTILARKPDITGLAYFEPALARRHAEVPLTPSQRAADASKINWDSVAGLYAKTAVWSRQAGPDPESAACRCPVDILVKHGLRKMAVA